LLLVTRRYSHGIVGLDAGLSEQGYVVIG
jgi:hypothetical protein